jgi:hypothetical protein
MCEPENLSDMGGFHFMEEKKTSRNGNDPAF